MRRLVNYDTTTKLWTIHVVDGGNALYGEQYGSRYEALQTAARFERELKEAAESAVSRKD